MRNTIYVRDPFREFDNIVRRTFGPHAFEATGRPAGFVPAAETQRDGDDLVIRLELPGLDIGKDVDVELVDRRLVISGRRRDERTESTAGGRVQEFRYGGFSRAFRLGPQVGAEQVAASYDAGVLTVRVAGAYAETAGQRIRISTGQPAAAVEAADSDGEPQAVESAEQPEA